MLELQLSHDLRPANAAIALACDVFRRGQPVVLLEPAADHQRNRIDIAIDRIEPLPRILTTRNKTAVAGADGIDEDEIGKVEPGLRVRLHLGRRRWRKPLAVERQPPWPDRTELEPRRRGARPAIEQERHRARTAVGTV